MKSKLPNTFHIIASLFGRAVLVLGMFVYCTMAQPLSQDHFITREEFEAVRKTFSSGKCDIEKFLTESKALGFKSTWRQFDDSPDEPEGQLADLGNDSVCLIAMSTSFQAYRLGQDKDGARYPAAIGPENFFPKHSRVTELSFFLPRSLAPKRCVTFEGPLVPYIIIFEKKNGKLVRRIDRTDADEDCFIAVMKKNLNHRK